MEEVRGGAELDRAHVASVLLGMIDQETLKHISQSPETLMNPIEIKRKALEFINMIVGPEDSKKGGFAGSLGDKEPEDTPAKTGEEEGDWSEEEYLGAMGGGGGGTGVCHWIESGDTQPMYLAPLY